MFAARSLRQCDLFRVKRRAPLLGATRGNEIAPEAETELFRVRTLTAAPKRPPALCAPEVAVRMQRNFNPGGSGGGKARLRTSVTSRCSYGLAT